MVRSMLSEVEKALEQYPTIRTCIPNRWLSQQSAGCSRELVDKHRVYRWLSGSSPGSWGGDNLAALERLISRLLERRLPGLDKKLKELWVARETRIDSLATELILIDYYLQQGYSLTLEPQYVQKRPDFVVNDQLIVEVKTYSPVNISAFDRLLFKILHDVPSGLDIHISSFVGNLAQNQVNSLLSKIRKALQGRIPGEKFLVREGSANIELEVQGSLPDATSGTIVSSSGEIRRDGLNYFEGWAAQQLKKALQQTKKASLPILIVFDVSLFSNVCDELVFGSGKKLLRLIQNKTSKPMDFKLLFMDRERVHFNENFSVYTTESRLANRAELSPVAQDAH